MLIFLNLTFRRPIDFASVGGVGHAELLGRSNIIAIVGGGQAPKFPHNNGLYII